MTTTTRLILLALGFSLFARPAAAQTSHAVLLERGIFLEETTGDTDGAIRIYREILAANHVSRDVTTLANVRLAESLRRKGAAPQAAAAPGQQSGMGCCGFFSGNYDEAKPVSVAGKIVAVVWMNPDSVVVVEGSDGNFWAFTLAAPNVMVRAGLNKTTLTTGEDVVVRGFLARGTGENCPTALPNACQMLTFPQMTKLTGGAIHASARSINTPDGRNLFDRPAMEKAAAAGGQ